jgi:anti-sigma regulatory factor (Ser/Thr protein kinase)
MKLELHATAEEVMRAVESLQQYAQAKRVPERLAFGLALALEECGSNVVNHALRGDARKKFRVGFARRGNEFVIELRDRGPEFDPTAAAGRAAEAAEGDPPGGWGIQIVRRYMDSIRYTRKSGENVLRLTKRLAPAAGAK